MKKIINFLKTNFILITIILLTVLGFVLRLNIGLPQLASDEVATVVTASQNSLSDILNALVTKNLHAPLFYFILHFWMKLFGESLFSLRLLPVILGTSCIPLAYLCAKNLVSKRAGVYTAALVAVNYFLISYSHFCKFYVLLQLLGFLSIYFLIKFDKTKQTKFLYLLALVNASVIYTYVLGFLYVLIQFFVYFGYRVFIKKDINFTFAVKYILALGILSLPIVPFIAKVVQNTQNPLFPGFWWYRFDVHHIPTVIYSWFSPALPFIYKEYAATDATQVFFSLDNNYVFLFNTFPLAICAGGILNSIPKKKFTNCLLVIAFLFVLAELFGAILGKFAFCSRATTLVFPAIILAAGCGLAQFEKRKLFAGLAVVLYLYINLIYLNMGLVSRFNTSVSDIFKVSDTLKQYELKENDFLIMPFRGYYLQKYYDTSKINFISYDINYAYKINDKSILSTIYDKNDLNLENGISAYEKFKPYLMSNKPSNAVVRHIKKECIDKLNKGDRVILIIYNPYRTDKPDDRSGLESNDIFRNLSIKLNKDLETVLGKYLSEPNCRFEKSFIVKEYKKE